jgi:hypothetical protein
MPPPCLRGSVKADLLEKLEATSAALRLRLLLVEEASPRVGEASAPASASASTTEKLLAASYMDRAMCQISDICELAAACAHNAVQSDCKNVSNAHFQLRDVLQVRRAIVKRLLADVNDEIAAEQGLRTVGVKRSKTEL